MPEKIRAYLNEHTNPPVFITSGLVMIMLVALAVAFPSRFGKIANDIQDFITTYFGWFYILGTTFILVFVVLLMFSRYGRIRLGPDDAKPDYATWPWVCMMFTAGMGIGLVYYSVAEPIAHFKNPPLAAGGTEQAAVIAMNYTIFHWGLHPWALYSLLGLALGYFSFRKGLPLKPAAAFYPLLGDRIYGPAGHGIDILAVFGTLFGLATSIGFGATQITAGLNVLFGIPSNLTVQLLVIATVEAVAITSIMLGIDAGIRRLSVINMWLAIGLCAFVFALGPTLHILNSIVSDTGYYLQHLPQTSLTVFPNGPGAEFQATWTLFYWGWWISWSPFVGMFIARISYGYTIRQLIAGTLLIPTGASIVWFVVFGRTALEALLDDGGNQALLTASAPKAIFVLLEQLPVTGLIAVTAAVVTITVVTLFFATSSDSGSLVVDILTNGGDPHPIWQQRLFWAVMEGLIAAVLLIAGAATGGDALGALQTGAVTTGLPFCAVLLLMCYTLYKALSQEQLPNRISMVDDRSESEESSSTCGARGQAPEQPTRRPRPEPGEKAGQSTNSATRRGR
ncbi:BCCT family transporter [Nitrococcus mobilis]|uniref:Choline/carnitine/betaine transport n=1 Tax=Nitrococcus mobilis Nb-231 TaxID=314278 RepID=A4BTL9_9GAMM|nr:BCCT family transporter [Nitrococcus mobilis]EAR20975.1 choline/carnitine/betaine transport [Nitrococcus mobilis Nb-231]